MNEQILREVRAMLTDNCPMKWDCGRKCGAACCQSDEDGQGGMYLFPNEESMTGGDWAKIVPAMMGGREVKMLVCDGRCERGRRPLACMIFPLTPVVDDEGNVNVRFDYRARAVCPLVGYGMMGLRRDFINTVREAMRRIASDEEGMDFLRDWQALEEQYDFRL